MFIYPNLIRAVKSVQWVRVAPLSGKNPFLESDTKEKREAFSSVQQLPIKSIMGCGAHQHSR